METKVSYTIVGAFVLIFSAAIIAGVLWLSSSERRPKSYQSYQAYFSESVGGLVVNAPVRYRGVEVGKVLDIAIDPQDPERVRLLLGIERGTPVRVDTVAVLRVQALTGVAYVDLGGGSKGSAPLVAAQDQPYPVIRTEPSVWERLDAATSRLLADLDRTSQSMSALLDEDNRMALKRTLAHVEKLTATLAARSGTIDSGVANAALTLQNAAAASGELGRVIERIGRAADAMERMAAETSRAAASARETLEGARRVVDDAGGGLQQVGGQALPELTRLLAEARELAASLSRVSRQLERNPSVLLLGRESGPPGPGE
jgi:phospholipid/cholesterol/gamma-HCH transport system substrate-binding protein